MWGAYKTSHQNPSRLGRDQSTFHAVPKLPVWNSLSFPHLETSSSFGAITWTSPLILLSSLLLKPLLSGASDSRFLTLICSSLFQTEKATGNKSKIYIINIFSLLPLPFLAWGWQYIPKRFASLKDFSSRGILCHYFLLVHLTHNSVTISVIKL